MSSMTMLHNKMAQDLKPSMNTLLCLHLAYSNSRFDAAAAWGRSVARSNVRCSSVCLVQHGLVA
jgi:hypothetical protein